MQAYEIRFYRGSGALSVLCLVNFASDRHAISSTRLLLNEALPQAAISLEGRAVADVTYIRPVMAA
jgi:hypothetical protein